MKMRKVIWCIIGAFFAIGLFVIISPLVAWDKSMLGLGIGIIAFVVGAMSMKISTESDKRMKAMANLEFYEKIAVIQGYLENAIRTNSPSNPEADRAYADRIYYDIKGAKQLEEWVKDPNIKQTLNEEIQRLLDKVLAGQTYEYLIKRLQQIQRENC